jgi:hypothetical protein
MPELARVFSSPIPINICGQDFILDPMTMADFSAVAEEIASHRKRGVMATAAALLAAVHDTADKRTIIREALAAANVTLEEAVQWSTTTPEGIAFAIWMKVEAKYPGRLTREQVLKGLIDSAVGAERFLNASGVGEEANFTSPSAAAAEGGESKAGSPRTGV